MIAAIGLAFGSRQLDAQITYSFTSAGATGRTGPTQSQLNSAYASTNLSGMVTSNGGIQTWTVPVTGPYRIDLYGASGGNASGLSGYGARVTGNVNLTAGTVLNILVGQMGSTYAPSNSDGGGGGSFVSNGSTLLAVAGGGGGAAQTYLSGQDASLSNSVLNSAPSTFGATGAGYNTNGQGQTWGGSYNTVAQSFLNGGVGMLGNIPGAGGNPGAPHGDGGFGGGGGSCSCSTGGGGGGGGYYGGGGGGGGYTAGYGGSSYLINTAVSTSSSVLNYYGNGKVTITLLYNVGISQTATIACNGNTNASLASTVYGGTSPYSYTWMPGGANTANLSGLGAGVYTLSVKDANNLITSSTYTITQPNVLSASSTQTNLSCHGSGNGVASVNVSGGTAPYTYNWSPSGGTSATASNLSANNYTCEILDANLCPSLFKTFNITQPAATMSSGTAAVNVLCNGGSNGSATVTVSGGTAPYGFLWSTAATTSVASNLEAGVKTVTITDANNCKINAAVTITQPAALVTNTSVTHVSCFGGNNGSATVTAVGGTGSYSYLWSNNATTPEVSNLLSSALTVTVTDANNCKSSTGVNIPQPSAITLTVAASTATLCYGNNAVLNAGAVGGTGAYNYAWLSGASSNSQTVSPSANTIYTMQVIDANNCAKTATIGLTVYSLPIISVNSGSICAGQVFTLNVTGAASYTYSSGSATVSPAITSNYSVSGSSAMGCISANPAVANLIVFDNPIVAAASVTNCAGGIATLTASGANAYSWSDGSNTNVINPVANTNTVFTVVGTSTAGCNSAPLSVSLTTVPAPSITVNSATICSGQNVTITASGVDNYAWSSGQTGNSIVMLAVSNTVISVSGTLTGCTVPAVNNSSITVNISPTIGVNSGNICSGNSFSIVPTGADIYTIEGGNALVNPMSTTAYTIVGISNDGCAGVNTATSLVTVNTTPTVSVNNGTICSGNVFSIIPSGASTYTIEGGNSNVSPSASTVYTVSGTAANGCISANTATCSVYVNTTPTISVNSGSICSGNAFSIIPSGADTYTIEGGNNSVSPIASSIYTVIGTALNGCIGANTASSSIIVYTTPTVNVNSGAICLGQSFTLTPSGANTYTFSNGSNVVNPIADASYSVSGTSTAGCLSANVAISNIMVHALPNVSVNSGAICAGNNFTIIPSGANTYTISGGNNIVSPTANSNYSVSGTSTDGCLSSNVAVSSVTVFALPIVSANSGAICAGDNFTIIPSGANTYTISGGNNIVSPSVNTNYSISGTSTDGCLSSNVAVSSVTVHALPVISVNSGAICAGDNFTIIPSGANTYTISGGNNVVSPSANTNYSINGTSNAGCLSSNVAISSVSVNALPVISVNSGVICAGDNFTIIPSGANTYTISGGNNIVSPSANTSYSVNGTSNAGCLSSNVAISSVTVNALPVISVNSGAICAGDNFTIIPSGANTYTISGGNNIVSPSANTNYSISGTSTDGCLSSNMAISSVTVHALPVISVNSGAICAGDNFTIIPSGANTYTISGGNNIVSPNANTNYSVNGTSTAGCVSSIQAISSVTVNALPLITVNSGAICANDIFTIIPSGANTYTISGGSNTVSPLNNSTYSVSGTSIEGCLSSNIAISAVTVNPLPLISVNSGSICFGKSFTITPSGAATYTISGGSLIVSPATNANYSVTGTSLDGCLSSNVAVSSIVVHALPSMSVVSSAGLLCSGNAATLSVSGAASYLWNNNATSSVIVVSPTTNSTYTVNGTSIYGCVNSVAFTQSVSACNGLQNIAHESISVQVYPNPTNQWLNVNIEGLNNDQVKLIIHNNLGEIVYQENLSSANPVINLASLNNGIYYLSIQNDNQIKTIRIIKE